MAKTVDIKMFVNGQLHSQQLFHGVKPKQVEDIAEVLEEIAYNLSMGDL